MAKNTQKKCLVCYKPSTDQYHVKCAKKLFGTSGSPKLELSLADVEQMAKDVVNKRLAVPGVQKKLSLDLAAFREKDEPAKRLTIVGYLGGTHILKPPTDEYPSMPEIENLTMLLAEASGIETAPHGLIRMDDSKLAYITRRFDRVGRKKVAVEDLCQLSEMPTEQKDKSTAERVGRVIRQYSSNPGDDALKYFELTIFSFVTGNADMHMKNFSMICADTGRVSMAPAYDLLATRLLIPNDEDELTLSVAGRKHGMNRQDFIKLGSNLSIPEVTIERTLNSFISFEKAYKDMIDLSILDDELKRGYKVLISARLKRLKGGS